MNQPPESPEIGGDEQMRMCARVANGTVYDPIKPAPLNGGVDTKKLLADLSAETDALLDEAIKELGTGNHTLKN